MSMAATNLFLFPLFFHSLFVPSLAKNLLSCEDNSIEASGYVCNLKNVAETKCNTFAILHTNSHYSSLFNLSLYLGLNRFSIAEANGFSTETEFLPKEQPLLIPIECKCSRAGFFQAELIKTAQSGESFTSIAESLEGLTTCKAIKERNVGLSPWNLQDKAKVLVPVRCACPTSSEISSGTKLLVSYPVISSVHHDQLTSLAKQFNTTREAILRANNRSDREVFKEQDLDSLSVLIPLSQKPDLLGSLAKPREPKSLGFAKANKKMKRKKLLVCVMVITVTVGVALVAAAVFFAIQWMKKQQQQQGQIGHLSSKNMADVELQQLSLSIRTTSEKKVSFEGSQSTLDGQTLEPTTPRGNGNKPVLENYTLEELKKATEDFSSHNLIEGSVYHGRLKGKNLAIKCTTSEYLSKVDFGLLKEVIHHHPNIVRVMGSCVTDGGGPESSSDSYLVFEYTKNGSLKDWIHSGLAMKSHFIASCSCFLTWKQRLRICLDVALALQYMHHIMHPAYVHRNIKSRNIFLDEEFNAKVGNFGIYRCVEEDMEGANVSEFNARNPASWSRGYLAPEYVKQGIVSPSIDVYAFGVVLLEVLSGNTPVFFSDEKEGEIVLLTEKAKSILWSENAEKLRGLMDVDLGEKYSFDAAITLANLARACIEDDPCLRPSAGEIVEKLSRLVEEHSPQEGAEQHFLTTESSSKPLVQAIASNNM